MILSLAEQFMAAAFCMLVGLGLLYGALELYGRVLDKILKLLALNVAFCEWVFAVRLKRLWYRFGTWYQRNIEGGRDD